MTSALSRRLALFLLLLAPPLFARGVTSSAKELVPDSRPAASLDQYEPSSATDGNIFLTAWTQIGVNDEKDVYAARLSRSGEVLDETPIPIAATDADEDQPDVVWSGEAFIVSWRRVAGPAFVRTVSASGEIGPVTTIASTDPTYVTGRTELAATAGRVLAVTHRGTYNQQYRIDVTLLSSAGEPLKTVASFDTFGVESRTAVAASASGFLLVDVRWNGEQGFPRDVIARRISIDGTLVSSDLIGRIENFTNGPSAAALGDDFLVLWGDSAAEKAVTFKNGSFTPPKDVATSPVATLVGARNGYLAITGDGQRLFAVSLDRNGVPSAQIEITHDGLPPLRAYDAVYDGSRALVVTGTFDYYDIGTDIFGLFVADDGRPESADPFWLARSPLAQRGVASAAGLGKHALLWIEQRPHEGRVVAVAAIMDDSTGEILTTTVLGDAIWRLPQTPRIVFNGSEYFAVWLSPAGIASRRVSVSGAALGTEATVLVEREASSPRLELAWNGTNYLVGYVIPVSADFRSVSLVTVRVSSDGTPLDAQPVPSAGYGVNAATLFNSDDETAYIVSRSQLETGIVTRGGTVFPSFPHDGRAGGFDSRKDQTDFISFLGSIGNLSSIGYLRFSGGMILQFNLLPPRSTPAYAASIARIAPGIQLLVWQEGTLRGDSDIYGVEIDDDGIQISGVGRIVASAVREAEPLLLSTADGVQLIFTRTEPGPAGPPHLFSMRITHAEPDRQHAARR